MDWQQQQLFICTQCYKVNIYIPTKDKKNKGMRSGTPEVAWEVIESEVPSCINYKYTKFGQKKVK